MQIHIACAAVAFFITIVVAVDSFAQVQPPVLKWQYGGCYASWCETGWYSSPAIADLNGDGEYEVIASAYSIVVLEGQTGNLVWRVKSGHDITEPAADNVGRTWPGVLVRDVDADGAPEIVAAHSGGVLSVYSPAGHFKPGWPRQVPPDGSELRGLAVFDLDGDGTAEILTTAGRGNKVNTWVYEHTGALRSGWPQLADDSGYAWGVYHDNAAVGDVDGDGTAEIFVPSDVHYICAYTPAGVQLPANAMYGGKKWGQVGVWESLAIELRGWGACDGVREESYRTNFAHGAAILSDVDADGTPEVVVTGNVYDCDVGHPPGKYTGVYIFNADRSRFNSGGFDWQTPPVDTGAPLSEDYSVIENCQSSPVAADLDGDGNKEILFAAYDGRVHAFWLDKTEHHSWPHSVYNPAEGFYRFASEPVIADLDADGKAEVLFTSWVQKKTTAPLHLGKLHILDYRGIKLHEITLPPPRSSAIYVNGGLPAPAVGNIDDDDDLEIVVNTIYSGVVAYDLPDTSSASILVGGGREGQTYSPFGDINRDGRMNLADAITALKIVSGIPVPAISIENAPVQNGRIGIEDALFILQAIALLR